MAGIVLFELGMDMKEYGIVINNPTLSTIGSYVMIGGSILAGGGLGSLGLGVSILGNGYMGGINNAMNGVCF